jgi:hypothetical protein
VAGKFGRKPFDPELRYLVLERYLDPRAPMRAAVDLPPVPSGADVDRATLVASWPMYLNDSLGDCTCAGAAHMLAAMCVYAGYPEPSFSDQEIIAAYSAAGGYVPGNPATDQGALCSDVLAYLQRVGMTDTTGKVHKVAGFAKLGNAADLDLLGQVLEVTGTVYTGFDVQQHMVAQFDAQQPWTWQQGDSDVGGHCVVLERRRPVSDAAPLSYVTWGALQSADSGFQAHAVEEAWFVASEDFVRSAGTTVDGLDLTQLLSDAQYV